jgi:outer membrane protein OmpA-like peptidoglycan-associated protein
MDQFEDEDGCPELDNDKDGIPDLNDACPNAAEDGQGKKPKDGCPSTTEDTDGDGVPDVSDKCPDEPEDRDGFQDDDGCEDPDNDADGIPDNFDNCPNDAEDPDGFEDEDGCPDPDNDKDGIPDAVDRCPAQAETWNGNKDDDGCPDPGADIVRIADGKIQVDQAITFHSRGGKLMIKDSATKVANLVALAMKGHPEIGKVRIEVHADGITKEDTQKRAEAVRDFLVEKGVATNRLTPIGLGPGGSHVDFVIDTSAPAATPAAKTPPAGAAPKPAAPAAPAPAAPK